MKEWDGEHQNWVPYMLQERATELTCNVNATNEAAELRNWLQHNFSYSKVAELEAKVVSDHKSTQPIEWRILSIRVADVVFHFGPREVSKL